MDHAFIGSHDFIGSLEEMRPSSPAALTKDASVSVSR
jgi:hypothetical protein